MSGDVTALLRHRRPLPRGCAPRLPAAVLDQLEELYNWWLDGNRVQCLRAPAAAEDSAGYPFTRALVISRRTEREQTDTTWSVLWLAPDGTMHAAQFGGMPLLLAAGAAAVLATRITALAAGTLVHANDYILAAPPIDKWTGKSLRIIGYLAARDNELRDAITTLLVPAGEVLMGGDWEHEIGRSLARKLSLSEQRRYNTLRRQYAAMKKDQRAVEADPAFIRRMDRVLSQGNQLHHPAGTLPGYILKKVTGTLVRAAAFQAKAFFAAADPQVFAALRRARRHGAAEMLWLHQTPDPVHRRWRAQAIEAQPLFAEFLMEPAATAAIDQGASVTAILSDRLGIPPALLRLTHGQSKEIGAAGSPPAVHVMVLNRLIRDLRLVGMLDSSRRRFILEYVDKIARVQGPGAHVLDVLTIDEWLPVITGGRLFHLGRAHNNGVAWNLDGDTVTRSLYRPDLDWLRLMIDNQRRHGYGLAQSAGPGARIDGYLRTLRDSIASLVHWLILPLAIHVLWRHASAAADALGAAKLSTAQWEAAVLGLGANWAQPPDGPFALPRSRHAEAPAGNLVDVALFGGRSLIDLIAVSDAVHAAPIEYQPNIDVLPDWLTPTVDQDQDPMPTDWPGPAPAEIDGITISPANCIADLEAESREMNHCVGWTSTSYRMLCLSGRCQILRLRSVAVGDGKSADPRLAGSTVQVDLVPRDDGTVSFVVTQHKGYDNKRIPPGHQLALQTYITESFTGPAAVELAERMARQERRYLLANRFAGNKDSLAFDARNTEAMQMVFRLLAPRMVKEWRHLTLDEIVRHPRWRDAVLASYRTFRSAFPDLLLPEV